MPEYIHRMEDGRALVFDSKAFADKSELPYFEVDSIPRVTFREGYAPLLYTDGIAKVWWEYEAYQQEIVPVYEPTETDLLNALLGLEVPNG